MVEEERAICTNISLYPKHIEAVKRYAVFKKYKYDSEAYQNIIDEFFTKDDKGVKHDFILYLFVPGLFCLLTTIINLSTDNVFNSLLEQGLFFNDLFILSRVFMILSFGSIGVLIACVYLLRKKLLGNKEKVFYGD